MCLILFIDICIDRTEEKVQINVYLQIRILLLLFAM